MDIIIPGIIMSMIKLNASMAIFAEELIRGWFVRMINEIDFFFLIDQHFMCSAISEFTLFYSGGCL